jgi:hypothetical protein
VEKLYNEKFNDLYCPTNTVQVIKSIGIIWAGHVARMGRGEAYRPTGYWLGSLRERVHVEDPDAHGRIILR